MSQSKGASANPVAWVRRQVDGVRELRDERRELHERLARVEDEVQECRALNGRLAELTDIVGELLLPVAARDEEKLAELLKKYGKDL